MYSEVFARVRSRVFLFLSIAAFGTIASVGQAAGGANSAAAANGAAPASATTVPSSSDRVILKVGDTQLTEGQFETMIADLVAQQGPADLSRKALGDNFASLIMLSQVAVAQHLDSSPQVMRQLALDRTQILSNAAFAALKAQAKPTAQQISDYYNSHLDDYDVVQIRRTFIWTGSQGSRNGPGLTVEQAKAVAAAVRQAYASGGDVNKAANSIPHTSEEVMVDEEPLPFQRGELPERLNKAAFALKEGEWTELNDAPGTYVFIQVVKRSRRALPDVSAQIEKHLQSENLKEELEALKKKTGIWMDESYFASKAPIPSPTTQSEASGLNNSTTERGEK